MKNYLINTSILILFFVINLSAQSNIKWEENFSSLSIPQNWLLIDADESGNGYELVQSINLDGEEILPQTGQSFWVSNAQNSNLAGEINEWLISPRISVIYKGDSLFFWAGSVGGPFNDSIKIKVSTTNNLINSFNNELGYFKVDGPVGSWHRYGFDLSEFDSMDIYFAINYYIKDGGPGGAHSDFIWVDHPIITGDPATINNPPTITDLLSPANGSSLALDSESVKFQWTASKDSDDQELEYTLSIIDVFPPIKFSGLTDTVYVLNWKNLLNEHTTFRWTIEVSDGKSHVAALDTFSFSLGVPMSIEENVSEIPVIFNLKQNYPNPFNPSTTISYSIPKSGNVTLKVFDILGKEIASLVDEYIDGGNYTVEFNANNFPSGKQNLVSGIYFYQLQAGDFIDTKKFVLIK